MESEKLLTLAQFSKFIINSKNLLYLLKRCLFQISNPNRDKIASLMDEIEATINKYHMNFDLCCQCGHPKPEVPSIAEKDSLEFILSQYIKSYEVKTGEIVDLDLSSKKVETEELKVDSNIVPESMKSLARKEGRPIHIKGKLLKVS